MLKRVDWVAETIRRCPRTRLITRAAELTFKPGDDAIGVIIHMTGNNQILSLEAVDAFFAHGVRATHPAMGYHNRWCSGTEGKPSDPVLTEFGREVIARYNELGVVLDTAHATDASAQAMIRASTKPVIDGHTTSRNLVPQSRGLSDDTLKMIADTGGVVGIHFADHLLTSEVWRQKYARSESDGVARRRSRPRLWEYNKYVLALTQDPEERVRLRKNREAQESFFRERNLSPDPSESTPPVRVATLKHMGDAIDYLVNLLGIEHVAVGGDVDGIDDHSWPDGMDHVGELAHLTAELMRRGYKEEALRKFLAENWLRVYRQCLPP
jgi:membrane dipeptidase